MTFLIYINDQDIHAHATSETEALPFLCILLRLCVTRRFGGAYGARMGVLRAYSIHTDEPSLSFSFCLHDGAG